MILVRIARAAKPGAHPAPEEPHLLDAILHPHGNDLRDDEEDDRADPGTHEWRAKALWRDAGQALVQLKKALRAPALSDTYRQQYANPVDVLGRIWTLLLSAALDLRAVRPDLQSIHHPPGPPCSCTNAAHIRRVLHGARA